MLDAVTSGAFTIASTLSAVAVCASSAGQRIGTLITEAGRAVARRPIIAGCLIILTSLGFNYLFAKTFGWPFPHVHDEFSYQLAADTFLHGRLTNPPHPMWKHLETLQVIQQPTYASKYPPAQGGAIALGELISGRAIVGVWLSSAAACAAIYWMLLGWLPRSWALLGAMLAVFHPELLFWSQCFWGGSIALGAGALVAGALPRIIKTLRLRDVVLLGIGIALLANARPFEGSMFVAGVLAVLGIWSLTSSRRPPKALLLRRVVIPLGVMMAVTFAWIGYYNWRVTGNPLKMPYVLHEQQYSSVPLFLFQHPRSQPEIAFPEIRGEHVWWELDEYYRAKANLPAYTQEKISLLLNKYEHQTALLFPLILIPLFIWRDRRLALAVVLLGTTAVAVLLETFTKSHYIAPAAGIMLVLVVGSLRHLNAWQRERRAGQLLVWTTLLVTAAGYACRYEEVAHPDRDLPGEPQGAQRERIARRLSDLPGRQLVLVSYQLSRKDTLPEWVYNGADIDGSKIVWAHDMGAVENQELLNYFHDRQVWTVTVSEKPAEPIPYNGAATTQATLQPASQPAELPTSRPGEER